MKQGDKIVGFCSILPFFIKHSFRELCNSKCNYVLSLVSILLAILIAMTSTSLTSQSPLIYLKLAEMNVGQYDVSLTPEYEYRHPEFIKYLNYSQIQTLIQMPSAPRKIFPSSHLCMTIFKSIPTENMMVPCIESNFSVSLTFIDTEMERAMGLGTSYKLSEMNSGDCVVPNTISHKLGAVVGDYIGVRINSVQYLNYLSTLNDSINYQAAYASVDERNKSIIGNFNYSLIVYGNTSNYIGCKISEIIDGYKGKGPSDESDNTIFMEYKYLNTLLFSYFPSTPWFTAPTTNTTPYDSADVILVNLPNPRELYYKNSDFDAIKATVTNITGEIVNSLGFYPIAAKMPLLDTLYELSMGGVFLGIILNLIVVILSAISILLIYTLLMVSIEAKSFDMGVMRLCGLTKMGVVGLITIQAFLFVIPAFVLAMILVFPALSGISTGIKSILGVGFSPVPSAFGLIKALVIGLVVPFLSSLIPIYFIMTQKLVSALDTSHSKISGTRITIEYTQTKINWPFICLGIISVVFGVVIYYLLPLSIFTMDFQLMLWIMLGILLAIIIALIILTMNFLDLLQKGLIYLLLFFESTAMKLLVNKCLISHKFRNRRTTVAYALSLSFIIFSLVGYHLELSNTLMLDLLRNGAPIVISGVMSPWRIEPLLMEIPEIEDFSWAMPKITDYSNLGITTTTATDYARTQPYIQSITAIAPNYFNVVDKTYLQVNKKPNNGLALGELLYTPKGSQSVGLSTLIAERLNLGISDNSSFLLIYARKTHTSIYQSQAQFVLSSCPGFKMSWRVEFLSPFALMSIPVHLKMVGISSIQYSIAAKLMIKPRKNADIASLISKLNALPTDGIYSYKIWSYANQAKQLEQPKKYLDLVFTVIIVIFMFLCYFSLSSSMATNIFEQSKEIAVMRTEGMTRSRIIMLYIYEALILVVASSLLGIVIGGLVAFSFSAQRAIWSDIPIMMNFDYVYILVILATSLACSFLSAFFPARYMMSKPISQLTIE